MKRKSKFFGALSNAGRFLRTGWCILGICLLTIVSIELGLRVVCLMKDSWVDTPVNEGGVFRNLSKNDQADSWRARYEREYTDSWHVGWQSYTYWRRLPFRGEYINVDQDGIRQTWEPTPVREGGDVRRKRVLVFGGSTIWGTGARDNYTIPSFLAKKLDEVGIPVEVVNLGEAGYVSTQEVIALILRLQNGDIPDAVVFYDGANDAFSAYQNGAAGIPQNEYNRRTEFNLRRDPARVRQLFFRNAPAELEGLGRFAAATRRRFGVEISAADEQPPAIELREKLPSEVVRIYEANTKLVKKLADSYGFTCHFFWQPIAFTKRTAMSFETQWSMTQSPLRSFCLAVYATLAKSKTLNGDKHFHDISSILDDVATTTYLDWAHVTEDANKTIAEIISEKLIPELKARPSISQQLKSRTIGG